MPPLPNPSHGICRGGIYPARGHATGADLRIGIKHGRHKCRPYNGCVFAAGDDLRTGIKHGRHECRPYQIHHTPFVGAGFIPPANTEPTSIRDSASHTGGVNAAPAMAGVLVAALIAYSRSLKCLLSFSRRVTRARAVMLLTAATVVSRTSAISS